MHPLCSRHDDPDAGLGGKAILDLLHDATYPTSCSKGSKAMKDQRFSHALSISAATALLAACGGSQPAIGMPGAMPQSAAAAPTRIIARYGVPTSYFRVLYRFGGGSDGARPAAALIDVNGTLYGTTENGGGSGCKKLGCGTVYSVTTSGAEKVLHRFAGGSDGEYPAAALIDVNGTLYGTTEKGGSGCTEQGCGTVYSISPSGSEKVLHSFAGPPDGAYPAASLINVNGTLYGTTTEGGISGGCRLGRPKLGCGTVYSISASGAERVLYRFVARTDGVYPTAALLDVNGALYGTTMFGGNRGSYGTFYSVSTSGSEKVLYRFASFDGDGAYPKGSLIDVNGMLYGTTAGGGDAECGQPPGCGTVYRITTTGTEKVLYRFGSRNSLYDGEYPLAALVKGRGTLYGTTYEGGEYGVGTVYRISKIGAETVLHSFGNGTGGGSPDASLILVNGTLYGVAGCCVFALTP